MRLHCATIGCEKTLGIEANYSIHEYPQAVCDHSFEKRSSSMSPQETLANISEDGDCKTTPKAIKPSKNYNRVAKNLERVNTSLALSTPSEATSHDSTRTEIQGATSLIQSRPSSTFKGKIFSTPNSSRFPHSTFFTKVVTPSFNSENFGIQGHDSQSKLPHIFYPSSFEDSHHLRFLFLHH